MANFLDESIHVTGNQPSVAWPFNSFSSSRDMRARVRIGVWWMAWVWLGWLGVDHPPKPRPPNHHSEDARANSLAHCNVRTTRYPV